jgi:ankyrin repeat protein
MPDGSSALFAAAAMNKLTVVKYLLAAGADKDWGTIPHCWI